MAVNLDRYTKDYHLKAFYTAISEKVDKSSRESHIESAIQLAPFIKKFSSTYVNYYGLRELPPMDLSSNRSNRLEEFYEDLSDLVLKEERDRVIEWILDQKTSEDQPFFPRYPVPKHYQDLTRGLNLLIELVKGYSPTSDDIAKKLSAYAELLLKPEIDQGFEEEAKQVLDQLARFDARKEGVGSVAFLELSDQIHALNDSINTKLIGNNTFVSLTQQIIEINKALKSVFRKDFDTIFQDNKSDRSAFWKGLISIGYSGGEKILSGSFPDLKSDLNNWLSDRFPDQRLEIMAELEKAHRRPELPILDKAHLPEAIQLFALNLLGMTGLRDERSKKLVLSFCSRFINKTVRDGALRNVRKNGEEVRRFFYQGLKTETDYQQRLAIASQHDAIFDQISAIALLPMYDDTYHNALEELDQIIGPSGFWLSDFIKSAYLIQDDSISPVEEKKNLVKQLASFQQINQSLIKFKSFIEGKIPGVFSKLLSLWGLSYVVSWSLVDYDSESRLFGFIARAAESKQLFGSTSRDQIVPLNDIIMLLADEPDAKRLIEKLMTYLLNSKISFDFPLFQSLFRVVAQRDAQLEGGIIIRDGFSEQRGYASNSAKTDYDSSSVKLLDPHIFHPIVVFLITVLNMKKINIPKDAFIETDISLYLNSLAAVRNTPELGYQMYLAHKLISSIPYIVDFSSHHEGIIRKTIADLDESYKRKNILFHYLRIKIHRAPSKLDLDYCLTMLDGLAKLDLNQLLANLIQLMKGVGDEAIPDLEDYFENFQDKLYTLAKHLKVFKNLYPTEDWHQIAEDRFFKETVLDLPGIDEESIKDILALVKLANALSNYWTQRVNKELLQAVFTDEQLAELEDADNIKKLDLIRDKRKEYQNEANSFNPLLEPYQHIFLKRHVIQSDWNFDFFGFWPFYAEKKFETYNLDRKLSLLERDYLETLEAGIFERAVNLDEINETLLSELRLRIDCLIRIMNYQVEEGMAPSKFFMDTIDILKNDRLTISQLHDILGILYYRELSHVDGFIANMFGRFPEQITKALGRENLDYNMGNLSQEDDDLLYPLVQETVLGNIMASARPIHLLERHLAQTIKITSEVKKLEPSIPVFEESSRPPRPSSPVYSGYKSYALKTLKEDGFNVPVFDTLPVHFFLENPHILLAENLNRLKTILIEKILGIEQRTGKRFLFKKEFLTEDQWAKISAKRSEFMFDGSNAPDLLISARSGSYRSMPGILGTVLNIGYDYESLENGNDHENAPKMNAYRGFLSSFGNVTSDIRETEFTRIVSEVESATSSQSEANIEIISRFKQLVEERYPFSRQETRPELNWSDPLSLLAISVISVWNSWDSREAINLRQFLGISDDWKTAVILMEMKMADKNPRSFSAVLFSGDPKGKVNKPHGDILFGKPGEDIVSGLASTGSSLEKLETDDPELRQQIVDLLEAVKINKGNIDVDVEMVGEYDESNEQMDLFVIQERQMPLGVKIESEDFKLVPTDTPPKTTGLGVNGGVQYGVFLDGVSNDYYQLRELAVETRAKIGSKDQYHGPGIFLLMEYVTPAEALKMNLPEIDGIVTTKIGKSSHASISAKRDGKLFICEARIKRSGDKWLINGNPIKLGDEPSPEIYTLVAHPKSVSPYSGNIYEGKMKMTRSG